MQESNNDYMNNKYPTNPKLVIPDVCALHEQRAHLL